MKIVLHMGHGKTGTSSLQESLHKAAPDLRRSKVLYPSLGRWFVAHQLLLGLCGDIKRLPPWRLDTLGGPERAIETARSAWRQICEDIRRDPPELLILSSEYLSFHTDTAHKVALAELLSPLSRDITPVIYVRHPVDHFRSLLQQRMKFWDKPVPPKGLKLKEAVLDTEAAFGRPPELVAFDRKTLHGSDIICDFATRFLAPLVAPDDLPKVKANVSLSAEALVLLTRLRAEAGGTLEASGKVAKLIPLVGAVDREVGQSTPILLLPEVAEAALRAASSHRWLVESGRLALPGLEIDRIDGARPPDWMWTAPPETLFRYDPDRLESLRKVFDLRLASGGILNKRTGLTTTTETGPRNWVLRTFSKKLDDLQRRYPGPTKSK